MDLIIELFIYYYIYVSWSVFHKAFVTDLRNKVTIPKIPLSYFGKEKVMDVVAGTTMCHALTVGGFVYVWGSGNVGQTG